MRPSRRDEDTAKFLRGMTIGALIGAVIAGSSLWSRRRARPAGDGPDPIDPRPSGRPGRDTEPPIDR